MSRISAFAATLDAGLCVRTGSLGLMAVVFATSCVEFEADLTEPDIKVPAFPNVDAGALPAPSGSTAVPPGAGIEGDCDEDDDCREGLVCTSGACEAAGDTASGDSCTVSAECDDGQCVNGRCVPAGEGAQGEECTSAAQCAAGLRCGIVGLAAVCLPEGSGDALSECVSGNDCMSSLMCDNGQCVPAPNGIPGVPPRWEGVECDRPVEGPVRAYFEVPGAAGADELDFFRLPFPNDVRTDSRGRVELSDFPTPGVNPLVGVDPMKLYVDAVDGTVGWGTNPTVVFRFSGRIDFGSFDSSAAIHFIDITDPENPANAGIVYRSYSGDTNYLCGNHLTVRRRDGAPLEPGHVYAVWLGTDGRGDNGLEIDRSPNFEAMLENAVPGDSALADAHEKFQPFRDYLDVQELSPDDVLVATVITVGPARDLMSELNDAVRAEPVPTTSDWVLCGSGQESPCPQAEAERACGEGTNAYDEYHALVRLPIFQEGEAPYVQTGGGIQTSGPVRTEEVCMALSVPNAEMPEEGWPLVVFGHGTGGSFRSHFGATTAGALSDISGLPDAPASMDPDAGPPPSGPVRFAVLGYDAVAHGPRRGDSEEHPNHLFFNFLNPAVAQGNPLQGAADIISIARMAQTLDVSAAESGGSEIRFNPESLVFFGHSQGSIHGNLALPYAPEYKAATLSGNGVSLTHALLTKTEPENIAAVVPLVLNDSDPQGLLIGGDHHPALTVVQQQLDPSDGLNFAALVREPIEGMAPKHIFQTYGLEDRFSPPLTMRIYAIAAGLGHVEADNSANPPDDFPLAEVDAPLTASFAVDGVEYTTGVRQYGPPSGSDGHFVVFDVPTANDDMTRFFGMAARGQTPQIGE